MRGDSPCLAALAERAESIRREEIRRCRPLRRDRNALAAAEQISTSLIAAFLRPINLHVTRCDDPEEERYIRRLFDLPDELARDARETTRGAVA